MMQSFEQLINIRDNMGARMTRIKRIYTDLISVNPLDLRHPRSHISLDYFPHFFTHSGYSFSINLAGQVP